MPLTDKLEQRKSTIRPNLKSPTHTPFGSKTDLEKCTRVTFDVLSLISECFQSFHASTEDGFYPKHSKLKDDDDKIPYFDRGKQNCHC